MFIILNIQILEQKLIVIKYDVNLTHHLLSCAFMFFFFTQKGKIIKIYLKNDCMKFSKIFVIIFKYF